MLQETCFWPTTVTDPTQGATTALPLRADVIVIGGGYTGLAAARELALRGARVVLLEARTLGWGASSRNGGMALVGLKVGPRKLLETYGRELAQRMVGASREAVAGVERLVAEEQIECDYVRCGHLELAHKPSRALEQEKEAEVLAREFNYRVRLVAKGRLDTEIGSAVYSGGLVDENSGGLNPAKFVRGLARAAAKAGASLYENTGAERVERQGREFCVTTPRGVIRAEHLFVGTSGYTTAVTSAIQRRVMPIGSYIIATAPLPEALARELSPRGRMMFDTKNFLYYFRLTPDRRMLFGGRAGFYPESPRVIRESAEILRAGMLSVHPQLRDVPVEYVWGGTLDFAFDIMPHAGHLDGMYYALGYAGNGVAMATYLGAKMGAQMAGVSWDNPFAAIPFPTMPFYDGRPWFLPLAGWWYRFLDWVS